MPDAGITAPVTLREYYAGMAMQGLLRAEHEHNEQGVAGFTEIAEQAFMIADAMIARSKMSLKTAGGGRKPGAIKEETNNRVQALIDLYEKGHITRADLALGMDDYYNSLGS